MKLGEKIKRISHFKGVKQASLAKALNISQPSVSLMTRKAELDDYSLYRISKVLGVTPQEIRQFHPERVVDNINSSSINFWTEKADSVILHNMVAANTHHGEKIVKLRGLFNYSQRDLALKTGKTDKEIIRLEQTPVIDDGILNTICKAFGVDLDGFKAFTDQALNVVNFNFYEGSKNEHITSINSHITNNYFGYNPNKESGSSSDQTP